MTSDSNLITVMGFNLYCGNIYDLVKYCLDNSGVTVVNTLNPHSFIEQTKDEKFAQALELSDFLIPDGEGVVLAAKVLEDRRIKKISGYDLFISMMRQLNNRGGVVFFLGSTPKTLTRIEARMSTDFPNITTATHSPVFKEEFDQKDAAYFSELVNRVDADILLVGLTAPKQEKLIQYMRGSVNVKIVSGIGAVFDFYSGVVKRPRKIWVKLRLEWFIRFVGSPKKLWRRNFVSLPLFLTAMTKLYINRRFQPNNLRRDE